MVIDAVQFTGSNALDIWAFMGRPDLVANTELHNTDLPIVETREGTLVASPGDWIIKGVAGEFYPCDPEIFAATYDAAE